MKKLLLTLVGMVCMTAAMADDVYPYLTFERTDGSTSSIGAAGLTLAVGDKDNLTASNSEETKTFTLSELTKMYFSGTNETTTLKGDVNRDGKVDISDIVAIINQIAGTATYADADVNSDKGVDISDIVAVINIIAGSDEASSDDDTSSEELTDTIQTLNISLGNVTYRFRTEDLDTMTFENGATLTVQNRTFTLSDVTSMYVDNTDYYDNEVDVIYADTNASIFIAGNIAQYVSATESAAHAVLTQGDVTDEVTYNLSGQSDDGSFYMTGNYKATIDLRGLTLTNPNGAPINIQDGKRIVVSAKKDTENTLKDGSSSAEKGCFVIKGHSEFKGRGILNVYAYGPSAHGIKSGEYMSVRNCTINVLSASKDGVHCAEYLLMESGELNVSGVGDDCVQVELDGTTSTGATTDHEDEDSGNIYMLDGTMNLNATADAVKGLKSAGDIDISGGSITITQSGSITTTDTDISYPTSIKADGNINITGGTIDITNTGDGGKGISAEGTLTIDESSATTNITVKANGKGGTAENVSSGGSTSENSYKVYISLPATGGGGMGPGGSGNNAWKNPVLYNSNGTMIAALTSTVTKSSGYTTTTFYYYDFKDADTSVGYYIKGDDYTSRGGGGGGGTYSIVTETFSAPTSGSDIYYSISNSYTTSGSTRTYALSNVTNSYSGTTDTSEESGTGYNAIGLKSDGEMTIGGGTIEISNSGAMSKSIKSNTNVIISGGTLTLKPSGAMQVINNDASYSSGIKCDDLTINGGTVKMTVSGNAGRGISAKNVITNGGELSITNSGAGVSGTSDTYTAKCIKADTSVKLNAGTITLTASGTGGKGIKSAGTYSQGTSDGNGPTLTVTTTGSSLGGSSGGGGGWGQQSSGGSSAKGIKVMGAAVLYGGTTEIYTSTDGAEGFESKTSVDIRGGQHYFKCYDDCINSAGCIYFNGGVTVCWSTGNDAVDSNYGRSGAITIGNGAAFAYTTKGSPEEGFDCDNNSYIAITGTGIGLSAGAAQGGGGMGGGSSSTISNAKQGYYFNTNSVSYAANTYYTLADASGNNLVTYSVPSSLSCSLALFTAKGMVKGSKYYLWSSTSAPTDATTAWHGLYLGSSTVGTTQAKFFKDSNTSVNYFTAQ
mgnify:CR=1 FL=1